MTKTEIVSVELQPDSPAGRTQSTRIVAYLHGTEMWGYFTLWMPMKDYGTDAEEAKNRYRQDVKDHLQKLIDYL